MEKFRVPQLSDQAQARFNFAMLRLVGKTICECFYDAHGFKPPRGPTLSAIRDVTLLTRKYGIPKTEAQLTEMVRKICYAHGMVPLGRN